MTDIRKLFRAFARLVLPAGTRRWSVAKRCWLRLSLLLGIAPVVPAEMLSGRTYRRWLGGYEGSGQDSVSTGIPSVSVLVVGFPFGTGTLLRDSLARQRHAPLETVVLAEVPSCDAIAARVDGLRGEVVVIVTAELALAADATARLSAAIGSAADMAYGDADSLDRRGRRCRPCLRPHWSRVLAGEIWYAGDVVAFARSVLLRQLGRLACAGLSCADGPALLSGLASGIDDARIAHVCRFVAHRPIAGRGPSTGVASQGGPGDLYRGAGSARCPVVTIIIPNRDQARLLARCLRSIRKKTTWPEWRVVIVENGSRESGIFALYDRLRADRRVAVIDWGGSFNFAAINNHAVAWLGTPEGMAFAGGASDDLLVFLNNDVEIVSPNWLGELARYALAPDGGVAGAKLLYPNGLMQHAGMVYGMTGVAGHVYRFAPRRAAGYLGLLVHARDAGAVTGACQMLRREVFDRIGGFDETLAVSCNDADICLRARAAGLRVVWTPRAVLVHRESVSRGRDETPEQRARLAAEIAYLRERWGVAMADSEPLAHPAFDLSRADGCMIRVRNPVQKR